MSEPERSSLFGAVESKLAELVSAPSDINEHLPTLRCFAGMCSSVVEFGVRGVVSTWALLAGFPKTLRSYDIAHPSMCGGDLEALEAAAVAVGVDFKFEQADDLVIAPVAADMLFIDTLHTRDQLTKELNLHAAGVSMFLVMHDVVAFGERGELPGTEGLMPAVHSFLSSAQGQKWGVLKFCKNNNGLLVLNREIKE